MLFQIAIRDNHVLFVGIVMVSSESAMYSNFIVSVVSKKNNKVVIMSTQMIANMNQQVHFSHENHSLDKQGCDRNCITVYSPKNF